MTIETLWDAACSGKTEVLKKHYENGGEIGLRYPAFGSDNSLIAGAYRNGRFDTVRYLVEVGETIQPFENDVDLNKLFAEDIFSAAENLVSYFRYHNKNITKAQEEKIDALENALRMIERKI